MTFRKQLQWGGLLIMAVALLTGISNGLYYMGIHNVTLHALYGAGFTGLILTGTIIHIAQARRAGILELVLYLLTVVCLAYVNVATFLGLVEMIGMKGAEHALSEIRGPVLFVAVYGLYFLLMLYYFITAQSGVLPRAGGLLAALGIALQLPAQFAQDFVGPMFFIFAVLGSLIFTVGLLWIGWSLWSGKGLALEEEPRLSILDRGWGAPFIILSALLLIADAYLNSIPNLTLLDSIIHLTSTTALMLVIVILHVAQAARAGGVGLAGFFFLHLGATLSIIPAYLIMAQLAGYIEDNRALMISWVDIPIGRYGSYMLLLGILLFGVSALRAEVFPKGSAWLVVSGLALLLPSQFQSQDYLFTIFWIIGATLLGIGLGWMGWSLYKKNPLVE